MEATYHIGKARDMVADKNRTRELTGIDDVSPLRTQLSALIYRIDQLNDLADAEWADLPRNTDKLTDYVSQIAEAYDAMHLHSRVYERIVRQIAKPLLAETQVARDLSCDAPPRLAVKQFLRVEVGDYLTLESEIADNLRQLDAARNAVAEAHRDLTDKHLRGTGRDDEISLTAGRHAVRRATTRHSDEVSETRKGRHRTLFGQQYIRRIDYPENSLALIGFRGRFDRQ